MSYDVPYKTSWFYKKFQTAKKFLIAPDTSVSYRYASLRPELRFGGNQGLLCTKNGDRPQKRKKRVQTRMALN